MESCASRPGKREKARLLLKTRLFFKTRLLFKTRLQCKLHLWTWRRRRCSRCRFRTKRGLSPTSDPGRALKMLKNEPKPPWFNPPMRSADGSPEPTNQSSETQLKLSEAEDGLKHCRLVTCEDEQETGAKSALTCEDDEETEAGRWRSEVTLGQSQATPPHRELGATIKEFLSDFYVTYGSFIPLHHDDVLTHVKRTFNNADLSDRRERISFKVAAYQSEIAQKATPLFCVRYRKHTLRLDDLLTLADQNWLNDQVINMYGELIADSSNHKVHFLNSFFHRQLMTKGYEGVKRWTKKVDLFSKDFLLVPVHLEVHWCLVTVDVALKKIRLYDSQGSAFHKVAQNILRYLKTEAKEKHQIAFNDGWMVSLDKNVPQQRNSNDCGVFILEYSRCLGLNKPLHFTQNDVPKIRKRIYRELCECKLHV